MCAIYFHVISSLPLHCYGFHADTRRDPFLLSFSSDSVCPGSGSKNERNSRRENCSVIDRDRPRRASPRNRRGCCTLRLNWLGSLGIIKSRWEAFALNIKFRLACTLGRSATRAALVHCVSMCTKRCVQRPINRLLVRRINVLLGYSWLEYA